MCILSLFAGESLKDSHVCFKPSCIYNMKLTSYSRPKRYIAASSGHHWCAGSRMPSGRGRKGMR